MINSNAKEITEWKLSEGDNVFYLDVIDGEFEIYLKYKVKRREAW